MIGFAESGRGGVAQCPVEPQTVFRTAIALGCSAIAVSHNHPSGDPAPSKEDLELTKRLRRGAELLGIQLLDHVIVTDGTGKVRVFSPEVGCGAGLKSGKL